MRFDRKVYNKFSDCWETYYWDEATQTSTIKTTWDVGDILDQNKRRANSSVDSRFGGEMLHHVAEIPMGVIMKLKSEHNIDVFDTTPDTTKRLLKLLDDPEWRYLKSTVRMLSRRTIGA